MANTLDLLDASSSDLIFTYYPLNHISPDGSFTCASPSNDCDSSRFDSCLIHEYCYPNCAGKTAQALVSFLRCYEGPYANTEHLTDPRRRKPCMEQANLDYNKIKTCSHNASQYLPIEIAINTTRAPMYQAIQPNPGYFPHIFIDGQHQYNDSWTALLRTLCTKNNIINSPACDLQQGILFSFNIGNNVSKGMIQMYKSEIEQAINEGINLAASEVAYPIHWKTNEDDPTSAPSYVNVQASQSVSIVVVKENGGDDGGVYVRVEVLNYLSEFVNDLKEGCGANGNVTGFLEFGLTSLNVLGNVSNVYDVVLEL